MTRLAILSMAAALFCGCLGIHGSGVRAEEHRRVGEFSAVSVSDALEAEIVAGDSSEVTVTGDDNIVHHIETVVSGGRLHVRVDSHGTFVYPVVPLRVRIQAPASITSIEVSGASRVVDLGIDTDRLEVEVSGASELVLGGSCHVLDAEVSGASKLSARDLATLDANVSVSGASKAEINASAHADVEASGASKIVVSGGATIDSDVSGASSVRREE